VVEIAERLALAAWYPVFLHPLFRESLAGFYLRGSLGRPENGYLRGLEPVDDAFRERCLRADDYQTYFIHLAEFYQFFGVGLADGDIVGYLGGSGIAGSYENLLDMRALGYLPYQSVFSPSVSNNQYLQFSNLPLEHYFLQSLFKKG
jgi:hypothetical protein